MFADDNFDGYMDRNEYDAVKDGPQDAFQATDFKGIADGLLSYDEANKEGWPYADPNGDGYMDNSEFSNARGI